MYSSTATYSNSVKSITGATGGTISSNVCIGKDGSTENTYISLINNNSTDNSVRSGSFQISSAGNLGIWDSQNSKWIIRSSKTGDVTMAGTSDYATNSGSASKATSATSATYSSTANYANAVKTINGASGGTVSSNIMVNSGTTELRQVRVGNSLRTGSLHVSSAGNLGIYDNDNSKWLICASSAGDITMNGTANYAKAAGSLKDALVVDYFNTTQKFVFRSNYTNLCTATVPTKSGYKLKDLSFFLISKKQLDLTKIGTDSSGFNACSYAIVTPFYSNTTTMTSFYYDVYVYGGSDTDTSTAYIYFKCLWVKEQ